MIKIISGTYGYRDGDRVIPKTSADAPFSLSPKREKELVDDGVAIFVNDEAAPAKEPAKNDAGQQTPPQDPPADNSQEDPEDELPAYSADMKMDELKEIAQAYGVDASKAKSKAEIIAMIDKAKAEETVDDGEEPPKFDAEPPVVE